MGRRRGSSEALLNAAYESASEYLSRHSTALTLRGLFYILVSKGVIPNTVYA